MKDAVAPNVPNRTTYVTRGHPIWVKDKFLPAECLINNHSIKWETIVDKTFYNIECADGNIFIANNLLAGDTTVSNIDYEFNQKPLTRIDSKLREFKHWLQPPVAI